MNGLLDATLAAAARGDEHAWRKLVDGYSGRVYGLLYRQCRDGELAEEITQATFVKVVAKLGDYEDLGRFESWLFRIAINRLRDEMRRRGRQASPVDFAANPPESIGYNAGDEADAAPETPLVRGEQHQALREAVDQLPEADRQLLEMRYTAEMSYQQIADALAQPLGTVLARGHRALKKLRTMLAENVDAA